MAVDRVPVLKRCRSLDLDPIYLGIDKKSNRQSDFAVRQEVYAKADTPWTRKPGEGQA